MCIIIIKNNNKQFNKETAKKASQENRDGLGVVWLDTWKVTYHKSNEYSVLDTTRPFIAHFRYATVGKVGLSNTHPFRIRGSEYLMMNGTIRGMGCSDRCDTKELAEDVLSKMPKSQWRDYLEKHDSRFVTFNVKEQSYQIYNKKDWYKHDGVWYSKGNVHEAHVVAVYGTLKKGYSNYNWHLNKSTFVGEGVTQDKYPLVISGLPYLIEQKDLGHNVKVHLFTVNDDVLRGLDRLEGHPTWYERKQIPIVMSDGSVMTAWIYFNHRTYNNEQLHEEYVQQPYSYSGYGRSYGDTTYSTGRYSGGTQYAGSRVGASRSTWDDYDDMYYNRNYAMPKQKVFANTKGMFDVAVKDKKIDKWSEKKKCMVCLSTVMYDGYDGYYCNRCDEFVGESHII